MTDRQSGWGGTREGAGRKKRYISVKISVESQVEEAARLAGFDSAQSYVRSEIALDARDTIARETGEPLCSVCEMHAGEIECAVCKKRFCSFHYAKTHIGEDEPFEQGE